jgi:hypothetical protein
VHSAFLLVTKYTGMVSSMLGYSISSLHYSGYKITLASLVEIPGKSLFLVSQLEVGHCVVLSLDEKGLIDHRRFSHAT